MQQTPFTLPIPTHSCPKTDKKILTPNSEMKKLNEF